ncbi:cysteine desulfurase-like protein [Ferroacidibacillus organovorans]|uniref:Cysteine desulfurase-like protein n=1 Tax=Ferroacidibacillus organovorans TaxID=1765683 RepID=A0A1V4EWV9_9BACL|nr:cysteine desulfurase-like protein [Ferroacidibacillus organovorans]OPG17427.1 cysteine desulfurase-like protein [Ferroacidibacillus organovorans]
MSDSFPIDEVRAHFPALKRLYHGQRVAYFDGPGGSQVAQSAIDAMTSYMARGGANLHGVFPTSVETEATIADAKTKLAAFLHTQPSEIAFGANMTTLTFAIARALARTWDAQTEIVVTELDHRANVDPWLTAARDRGAKPVWLRVNEESLALDLDRLDEAITPRTRVVAVGLASNAVGTITDVRRIAQRAHEVGALVVVDAVHAVPHFSVDREILDADILLCSTYKFFGPHVGVAAIREALFAQIDVYKLDPAPTYDPDKLETGTQNHEGIAGIGGALDFLASLGDGTTLREKMISAMKRIEAYEDSLARHMRAGLQAIRGVRLFSAEEGIPKTPTLAITVDGKNARAVCEQVVETASVFVADGHFYASTLADRLGVNACGGFVRAGIAPYNTQEEVDRYLNALERIAR